MLDRKKKIEETPNFFWDYYSPQDILDDEHVNIELIEKEKNDEPKKKEKVDARTYLIIRH